MINWYLIVVIVFISGTASKHHLIEWEAKEAEPAPDNYDFYGITINDEFPGPNLEFYTGDTVEIHLFNSLARPISLHWHGLKMRGTPESDRVPGVTQSPIAPGELYIYRFNIGSQVGTHWYHAHIGLDAELVFGAIIIHPNPSSWEEIITLDPRYDYEGERVFIDFWAVA